MKKMVLLWGSTGVYGDDGSGNITKYKQALDMIEEGSKVYNFEIMLVQYPGHPDRAGVSTGQLSFSTALVRVIEECERIEPHWIVGRSFGASIALAALGCQRTWVKACRGAVLWGPAFNKYLEALWPTPEDKARMIREYEKFNTLLAPDFFETLPDIETLVRNAEGNLRFARGTEDGYNSSEDLRNLETIHRVMQPAFKRQVIELKGFDHTPVSAKLTAAQREKYFECLFGDAFAT